MAAPGAHTMVVVDAELEGEEDEIIEVAEAEVEVVEQEEAAEAEVGEVDEEVDDAPSAAALLTHFAAPPNYVAPPAIAAAPSSAPMPSGFARRPKPPPTQQIPHPTAVPPAPEPPLVPRSLQNKKLAKRPASVDGGNFAADDHAMLAGLHAYLEEHGGSAALVAGWTCKRVPRDHDSHGNLCLPEPRRGVE